MSCIAGVLRRDGAGGEPAQTERMLARMKARAPDGTDTVVQGPLAMGRAFLRTGNSASEAMHRLTLDGDTWIVADARIDARAKLLVQLRKAGRQVDDNAPHAELILHAYAAFGDDFLEHLLGDFVFAIWDGPRRRLTCARDHFGVRRLYFSNGHGTFSFASDASALLELPTVSRQLDDTAVADYLLAGTLQDAERTLYRDIRMLPPAGVLRVTSEGVSQHVWWQLHEPPELRFRHMDDYVGRFKQFFDEAVADRLPGGPVALQLSGGMDSTAIAAVVAPRARELRLPVSSYHMTSAAVVPENEEEARLAQRAADFLGIPMARVDLGNYPLFARCLDPALRTAFPLPYPFLAAFHDAHADLIEAGARVIMSGASGDAALMPAANYYTDLVRGSRLLKFAIEAAGHVRHTRSVRGMGLRTLLRTQQAAPAWRPAIPDWIDARKLGDVDLAARWNLWWTTHYQASGPASQFRLSWLARQFESSESLELPVAIRYPFQDLRLVEYLMAIPNYIKADKRLLRNAMSGQLPAEILERPKAALAGDPFRAMVTNGKLSEEARFGLAHTSEPLISERFQRAWQRYCDGYGTGSTSVSWLLFQALSYSIWRSARGAGDERHE